MFKKYRTVIFYLFLAFLPVVRGCGRGVTELFDSYTLGFPFPFWEIPIDGASFSSVYTAGMFLLNLVVLFLFANFILKNSQRTQRFSFFTNTVPISFIIFVIVFILGYFGGMDLLENVFYYPMNWVNMQLVALSIKESTPDFIRSIFSVMVLHVTPRIWFIIVTLMIMPLVSWVRKMFRR
ncbi:MAG: hypothetical protein P9M07_01490 [Candidatus Aceula meridiana]|nr:hypothetical protein [Candidatus Aceula meridiana]